MNIQLHNVISDITGETGMKIVRSIAAGVQDPHTLAQYRDPRCKNSLDIIEKSLCGSYRDEHVFALQQALELYDVYQDKLIDCDKRLETVLAAFDSKTNIDSAKVSRKRRNKNEPAFDLTSHLLRITGTDLTAIPGIGASSALRIISEVGLDMSRWKSSKQFASWLGLCPGNKVSGGKQLSSKSKRTSNYASSTFRIAASTLHHNHSALGAFFRRLKSRLGAPKATTAAAHKLAVIVYTMLKNRTQYKETGQEYYENQYRERLINSLNKQAKRLGFTLTECPLVSNG
jgi:transposase